MGVVGAVGVVREVTEMHKLLFVLHVSMVGECEGARITAKLVRGTCGCGKYKA